MNQINRATEVADFTGRTLEGYAYKYEKPSRVSDDGWKNSYFEEYLRGADTKTLMERASFPLNNTHASHQGYYGKPVGEVIFRHSDDEKALMFVATVDHGRLGDQVMEHINAEVDAWSDVSIGAVPIRNAVRRSDKLGNVLQRVEIRLTELALAPNGLGYNDGAEITVVRSAETEGTPRLEVLRKRLILL